MQQCTWKHKDVIQSTTRDRATSAKPFFFLNETKIGTKMVSVSCLHAYAISKDQVPLDLNTV